MARVTGLGGAFLHMPTSTASTPSATETRYERAKYEGLGKHHTPFVTGITWTLPICYVFSTVYRIHNLGTNTGVTR
jgi:hypothetical protein